MRKLGRLAAVPLGAVIVGACALGLPIAAWATPGPPSAPRSVVLTPGNGRVTVHWVAPFSNGGHKVTQYEVLTYHNDVRLAINVFHSTKLTQQISGLKNGNTYTFTVGARNSVGWSRLSLRSDAVVVGTPLAPARPTVAAGKGRVTVTWRPPSSSNGFPVNGYRVTPYLKSTALAARVFNDTRQHATIQSLQGGRQYSFKVAAHNRNGWSYQSASSVLVTVGK